MSRSLREELQAKCDHLDVPMMGIAPAERWEEERFGRLVPAEFRPRAVWPEVRSAIVIGLPVDLPIVETAPSIYYLELYRTVNSLLDHAAYRMARFLDARGYPSLYLPRDGYGSLSVLRENPYAFFSHRHAAYLAGLGSFGVNNMLLTPRYGPRVRLTTIFTTAPLPPDEVMEEDLCIRCMRCVRFCPSGALDERDYPKGLTDKDACAAYSQQLARNYAAPCGACIKVCPVGEDRKRFERTAADLYSSEEGHPQLHRAWKHVRSYGSRGQP